MCMEKYLYITNQHMLVSAHNTCDYIQSFLFYQKMTLCLDKQLNTTLIAQTLII
jgi:hypothetical protein